MKKLHLLLLLFFPCFALGAPTVAPTKAEVEAVAADVAALDTSKADADGGNIGDPAAFLRGSRSLAYNKLIDESHELWRIVAKLQREQFSAAGLVYRNRFRSASFGDSVVCDIQPQVANFFGYGGGDTNLQAWTNEAGSTPTDGTDANYPAWSAGVFQRYDQWTRTPGGFIKHLDASFTGGTYTQVTGHYVPFHSAYVQFLAGNSTGSGDASYGQFKLQYQINQTGGWIDCTTASVSGGGSNAGGVINTNSGAAETFALAIFTLPKMDRYNLRLVATSGRVRLCEAFVNAGGWEAGAASGYGAHSGGLSVSYAQGGRGIASHFSQWSQAVLTAALTQVDPHVIIYKSQNEYSLSNYQTYWPALASKLMTAAPNALLVVCGSHPQLIAPGNVDGGQSAVDDYLRDWCATTVGAVFVDCRQNFPAFVSGYENNNSSTDDLWTDGVHIYSLDSSNWGGGDFWIQSLVWEKIRPAVATVQQLRGQWAFSNVLPWMPTEIRLYDGVNQNPTARTGKLAFTIRPRSTGSIKLRPTNAFYNAGTQLFANESGFEITASDATSPNSLVLSSNGGDAMVFGHNANGPLQGFAVGVDSASTTNAARTQSGYRFKVPWNVYGMRNGLIVEGRSDSATIDRLFGIDRDATDAAEGAPMHSWYEDGSHVVEGATNDANEATFTWEDPASDVTITTDTSYSGTIRTTLSGTASLDFGNIAAEGEATLTITVTGAVTANTPAVSLGWSAALPDGLVVKQAWVSAADTVSVRVSNITAATAIDPAAVTCRAVVTNF